MDVRNLAGKAVVVTGAGSGIGRASALAFASRGVDLAICDLNEMGLKETVDAVEALGRKVLARTVDVADPEAFEEFAAEVIRDTGVPHILMNNAGVGLAGGFLDTSLEDWDWILRINVRGVVHGCHYFL